MTVEQRREVRRALLLAGFRREYNFPTQPNHYDHGDGIYTELWRSKYDLTLITLEWDRKTPV